MIPRVIHYCWFGRDELPDMAKKCIASWGKHMPDCEIVLWNEDNFDIESHRYVKEAYESRKYAFVSDYVRLFALYHRGGLYFDTDVELVRPLDDFLSHEAFSGFESPEHVQTALLASVKRHRFIGELLSEYDGRRFVRPDGTLDTTTNVTSITTAAVRHGLRLDGTKQTVNGLTLYPPEYFCPYDDTTGRKRFTENTYCIHWFSKSWVDTSLVRRSRITRIVHRLFGKNSLLWLKKLLGETESKLSAS